MTVPATTTATLAGIVESKAVKDQPTPGSFAKWCSASIRPILAELISTGILVMLGCMTCIPIEDLPYQSPIYTPLGFGFVVSFNIQIFGHISGAHMNPAVSLAAMLWGSLSIALGICYMVAQVAGAVLGYGLLVALSPVDMAVEGLCATHPRADLSVLQVLGIEIVLTSTLNFLNCGVWDPVNQNRQDSVPLKFGLAIVGLSLAGGPLTGASMNPARSLGPAVWTGWWNMHWAYWVGPLIGGIIPVVIYKYALQKRSPKDDLH